MISNDNVQVLRVHCAPQDLGNIPKLPKSGFYSWTCHWFVCSDPLPGGGAQPPSAAPAVSVTYKRQEISKEGQLIIIDTNTFFTYFIELPRLISVLARVTGRMRALRSKRARTRLSKLRRRRRRPGCVRRRARAWRGRPAEPAAPRTAPAAMPGRGWARIGAAPHPRPAPGMLRHTRHTRRAPAPPAPQCAEPRGAPRSPPGDAAPRPARPGRRLTPPRGRAWPPPPARRSRPSPAPPARPSAPRARRRRLQVGARRGGCAARPRPCRARWDS